MNLEESVEHAGAVAQKLEEAQQMVGELYEDITTLHGVLQSKSSGHSAELHEEMMEALDAAKLKADELIGVLAYMRDN
jgi:hypothetical protein